MENKLRKRRIYAGDLWHKTFVCEEPGDFRKAIENAPSVDAVEVVHARWENVQNGKGCCSNCNRLDSIDNLATHCRYCGAKMDGERKDNE